MKKVKILSITENHKYGFQEMTEVYVDGKLIGDGYYGGEIEDNLRCRHYDWVEELLKKLAVKLDAEVEVVEIERKED